MAPIFTPVLPGVLESAAGVGAAEEGVVADVFNREEAGRTVGVVRILGRRWPSGAGVRRRREKRGVRRVRGEERRGEEERSEG